MPRRVIDWDEGACDALPGFVPTLTGGDGAGTQYCEHSFNLAGLHLFY
jgi:hypothetical protein